MKLLDSGVWGQQQTGEERGSGAYCAICWMTVRPVKFEGLKPGANINGKQVQSVDVLESFGKFGYREGNQ